MDREVLTVGHNAMANFQDQFEHFQFSKALRSLWDLIRHLNKYIDSAAPWTLYKNGDSTRLGTVMYVVLEGMRKVALHLWPVMPSASETMLAQLGVKFSLGDADLEGEANSWFGLAPGTAVEEKSNLFPRQEKDAAKIQPSPEATTLADTPHFDKFCLYISFIKLLAYWGGCGVKTRSGPSNGN